MKTTKITTLTKKSTLLLSLAFVSQLAIGQFVGSSPSPLTTTSKVTIGSSDMPFSTLDVNSPALGIVVNSQVPWSILAGSSGNGENLRIFQNRYVAGNSWNSAEIKIQKRVDATNMHYISFRGNIGNNPTLHFGYDNTDQISILANGFVGIGTTTPTQILDVKGNIKSNNEIISANDPANVFCQFRAIAGNYGLMLRNDGANSYFLLTDNINAYGGWNGLRPFSINNGSGDVSLGNGLITAKHNGNLGIGSYNPAARLSIANGADDQTNYGRGIQITNANGKRQQMAFIREGANVVSAGYFGVTNIWGFGGGKLTDTDFNPSYLAFDNATGKVAIGLTEFTKMNEPGCKLFVAGGILTEKVKVATYANWADYVFANEYELKSLKEVEHFINENKHLPNIPSAKEVKEKGLDLGDMQAKQMEKIEELTLYIIQMNKEMSVLKDEIKALKK